MSIPYPLRHGFAKSANEANHGVIADALAAEEHTLQIESREASNPFTITDWHVQALKDEQGKHGEAVAVETEDAAFVEREAANTPSDTYEDALAEKLLDAAMQGNSVSEEAAIAFGMERGLSEAETGAKLNAMINLGRVVNEDGIIRARGA